MSFKNYEQHIIQKYRLAVALAVLKEKPSDLSVETYIELLKRKINDENDDCDETICSDDFQIDDSVNCSDHSDVTKITASLSSNLIENGNYSSINQKVFDKDNNYETVFSQNLLKGYNITEEAIINNNNVQSNNNINSSIIIEKPPTQNNETSIGTGRTQCITIDENHQEDNAINVRESNVTKNINEDSTTILKNYVSNETIKDTDPMTLKYFSTNTTRTNTQSTKRANVDELSFNDSVSLIRRDVNTNRNITEAIQHNNESKIRNKDQVTFKDFSANITRPVAQSSKRAEDNKLSVNDNSSSFSLINNNLNTNIITNEATEHNNESKHVTINYVNPLGSNYNDERTETQPQYYFLINANDLNKNTDNININSVNNTQNYTHVSQSQPDNIYIKQIFLQPKAQCITTDGTVELNNEYIFEDKTNNDRNTGMNENSDTEMTNFDTNVLFDENIDMYDDIEMDTQINEAYPTQCAQETELDYNLDLQNTVPEIQTNEQTKNQDHTMKEIVQKVDENSKTQAELIPFKVLEELNKVKSYLGRRGERRTSHDGSLESGYKSDSQGRSFKGASQLTCNAINQSAHCLFDYLMNVPLLAASQGITEDISMTLSKLIDTLHEEEKYLAFLDKLLETVDEFLQNLFECDNYDNNSLLQKDEEIQRLLLLNHSRHIQSYTIDKTINILEKIHDRTGKGDQIFEIDNIDQSENACYIFHLLQLLLERYVKHKVESTPIETQNDLKKSSITDIWRKKWDPKFKEQPKIEGSVKKCVLAKCSEILNKLVVNCMDGYCLVSYAALQCFNVLQN